MCRQYSHLSQFFCIVCLVSPCKRARQLVVSCSLRLISINHWTTRKRVTPQRSMLAVLPILQLMVSVLIHKTQKTKPPITVMGNPSPVIIRLCLVPHKFTHALHISSASRRKHAPYPAVITTL